MTMTWSYNLDCHLDKVLNRAIKIKKIHPERLAPLVAKLLAHFPKDEVETYLANYLGEETAVMFRDSIEKAKKW